MAGAIGLTIPISVNYEKEMAETLSEIKDTLISQGKNEEEIKDTLNKAEKNIKLENRLDVIKTKMDIYPNYMQKSLDKQEALIEIEKRFNERDEQINKLQQNNAITKSEMHLLKLKERLYKTWDKWMVKFPFFQKIAKGIADIAKGIWQGLKNNWFNMLMGFLMVMMFDPEGKFLMSILDFIVDMGLMLVGVIIKYIPKIINTFIYLFTKVFPQALVKIVQAIIPAIGKILDAFGLSFVGDFFKKGGILYTFFSMLAKNAHIIIGVVLAFMVLFKTFGLLQAAIGLFSKTAALKLASILGPTGIILAGIAAITIGAKMFFDYASEKGKEYKKQRETLQSKGDIRGEYKLYQENKIGRLGEVVNAFKEAKGFFEGFYEAALKDNELYKRERSLREKLGISSIQDKINDFFKEIDLFVWKISDFFTEYIPYHFNKIINTISTEFKKTFDNLYTFFIKPIGNLPKYIQKQFKNIWKDATSFFTKTLPNFLSNAIPNILASIKDKISGTFGGAWGSVKQTASNIYQGAKEYGTQAIETVMFYLNKFATFLRDDLMDGLQRISSWFSAIAMNPWKFIKSLAGSGDYAQKATEFQYALAKANEIKARGGTIKTDVTDKSPIARAVRGEIKTKDEYVKAIDDFQGTAKDLAESADLLKQALKSNKIQDVSMSKNLNFGPRFSGRSELGK